MSCTLYSGRSLGVAFPWNDILYLFDCDDGSLYLLPALADPDVLVCCDSRFLCLPLALTEPDVLICRNDRSLGLPLALTDYGVMQWMLVASFSRVSMSRLS